MKKLLLLLILSVTMLLSQAQKKYFASDVSVGQIDQKTGKWVYGPTKPSGVTFTFNTHAITANDKNGSVYYIVKQVFDEVNDQFAQVGWEVKDQKGRKALLKIMAYSDGSSTELYVFYGDTYSLCYILSKNPR